MPLLTINENEQKTGAKRNGNEEYMRLICPNCGAQYEVDAQVIPDGGRDVQCSDCGHTWFQRPADQDADLADELGMELDEQHHPHDEPEQAPENFEPEQEPAEPREEYDDTPEATDAVQSPTGEFTRRELDEGVLDILRDEATRESDARRAEGDVLETQPDLGIDESDANAGGAKRGLRERMARLRGVDESDIGAGAAASGKRRDLLPDIEEINSTLRASSDREETEAFEEEAVNDGPRKNGFGRGFGLILVLAAIVVALYVFAPKIAAAIPALEGVLSGYVAFINGLRDWLDRAMQDSAAKLTELLSSLTKGK